ncbi:MAG TPA: hypothetical protein PLR53_09490, partial [Bacteroidales bacterium]|nr:hypothetical protein [Bacteroidales bacterium]
FNRVNMIIRRLEQMSRGGMSRVGGRCLSLMKGCHGGTRALREPYSIARMCRGGENPTQPA